MSIDRAELSRTLDDLGYRELFQRLDNEAVDRIWNQDGAPAALAQLALDAKASPQARFLAAEILFAKDPQYPPDSAKATLASVYAIALKDDFTMMANPWGLPGKLDSVGRHVVALGEAAVPEMARLLNNTNAASYGGSREATAGNRYHYRVKDIAAYLISQIKGIPYTVGQTPEERDAEIEQLKSQL